MQNIAEEFLEILNKRECPHTRNQIERTFGLRPEYRPEALIDELNKRQRSPFQSYNTLPDTHNLASPNHIGSQLIGKIIYILIELAEWQSNLEYKKASQKLRTLERNISQILPIFGDEDIERALSFGPRDRSAGYPISDLKQQFFLLYQELDRLSKLIHFVEEKKKQGKVGRKPQTLLDLYIEYIAELYVRFSGNSFTVDRFKAPQTSEKEGCMPITPGQHFAWKAVDWLHYEASLAGVYIRYASTNIQTACERTVKKRNQSDKLE